MTNKELQIVLSRLPDDLPVYYEEVGTNWTAVERVVRSERDATPYDDPTWEMGIVFTTANSGLRDESEKTILLSK